MGTTAQKLQAVLNSKSAIKQALVNKGKNPSDVLSTYAGLISELTNTEDATAAAADILKGKTAYINGMKYTGTIPSKAAATITPGTTDQSIAAGQYLSGKQTIAGDADLVSANIKAGKNIFGVNGKPSVVDTEDGTAAAAHILSGKTAYVNGSKVTGNIPSKAAATITPGTSDKEIAAGQYLSGKQTIAGDADLISANIKAGKNIFGVNGKGSVVDTEDAIAAAADIIKDKTAYVNGVKITGTATAMPRAQIRNNPAGTWVQSTQGSNNLMGIAYGEGTVVIGGYSGTIIRSEDFGTTWEIVTSGLTHSIRAMAFGVGHFVAAGSNQTIAYSIDQGQTWTAVTGLGITLFRDVVYAQNKFVAVGGSGICYSTDGETWTQVSDMSVSLDRVIYGNGMFIAAGSAGAIYRSYNGVIWETITVTDAYGIKDILYVEDLNKFYAAGTYGSIYSSTDGGSWTLEHLQGAASAAIYALAYGNGMLAAVGLNGNVYYSSGNGTWTNMAAGTVTFTRLTFTGSLFIAVGNDGTMAYSSNGSIWTTTTVGSVTFNDAYYVNGCYIAVGNSGMIATPPLQDAEAIYKAADERWHSYIPIVIDGDVDADDGQTVYMLVTADGSDAAMARNVTAISYEPLTATSNDIRLGTTAVTEAGNITGTKDIPIYHTRKGAILIPANARFKIPLSNEDAYDYTAFQAVIAPYNTSFANSVAVDKTAIENAVYPVNSTTKVSDITKDAENKVIDLGITNGSTPYVVQYFTYKEVY